MSEERSLCYQDNGEHRPAKAIVSISNCTVASRFVHIINTRPSSIQDASDWPNLEITEVIATIETGDTSLTLFILMNFPMRVDRISMKLSILYFKGSQVEIYIS